MRYPPVPGVLGWEYLYPHSKEPECLPFLVIREAVRILGNLGSDPELKYSQNGAAMANFRLAVPF